MFEEKFIVNSNDIDGNLDIRLSSLTRYMQQVATDHAETIKLGHKELSKDRLMWVVIRMEMHINRLPKLDEEFYVSTHPGETKAFLFVRYFQVYDKHHKLLASVSSSWVILNYDTRKVVIKPFEGKKLVSEVNKDDIALPEKITETANELIESRKARYSEVDMNGHINNTRYVDYILDLHNTDYFKEYRISKILINFDKEIKEGEIIDLYSNNSNPEIVVGKINGQNSFVSRIEYIRKKD